jgi:cytochrome c553
MNLTDQDILEIAKYYNSIPAKKGKITAEDNIVTLGQTIYRGGIEDRDIPACISCHGPKGLGIDRTGYPKVSGQHAIYLEHRLQEYKEGYDDRDAIGKSFSIMSSISFKLSNKEMKALSEYLQGLY